MGLFNLMMVVRMYFSISQPFKENNPLSLQKGNQVVFRSEESARGPEAISITVLSVIKAL